MLPGAVGELPPRALGPEEPAGDPSAPVPAEARRVYDVREVIDALVDGGESLELALGLGAQHGHRARPHRRPHRSA